MHNRQDIREEGVCACAPLIQLMSIDGAINSDTGSAHLRVSATLCQSQVASELAHSLTGALSLHGKSTPHEPCLRMYAVCDSMRLMSRVVKE